MTQLEAEIKATLAFIRLPDALKDFLETTLIDLEKQKNLPILPPHLPPPIFKLLRLLDKALTEMQELYPNLDISMPTWGTILTLEYRLKYVIGHLLTLQIPERNNHMNTPRLTLKLQSIQKDFSGELTEVNTTEPVKLILHEFVTATEKAFMALRTIDEKPTSAPIPDEDRDKTETPE